MVIGMRKNSKNDVSTRKGGVINIVQIADSGIVWNQNDITLELFNWSRAHSFCFCFLFSYFHAIFYLYLTNARAFILGKNMNLYGMPLFDWSPSFLTSDNCIRSNEIVRTKWPI